MPEFCDVAVPVPLDAVFTYRLNGTQPVVGGRVLVPFREQRLAGIVIEMRVADEQNLRVAELQSQFLHALLDQRHGILEPGVDQDISVRRNDQVDSQAFAADEIYVADDVVRWERSEVVRRRSLRGESGGARDDEEQAPEWRKSKNFHWRLP